MASETPEATVRRLLAAPSAETRAFTAALEARLGDAKEAAAWIVHLRAILADPVLLAQRNAFIPRAVVLAIRTGTFPPGAEQQYAAMLGDWMGVLRLSAGEYRQASPLLPAERALLAAGTLVGTSSVTSWVERNAIFRDFVHYHRNETVIALLDMFLAFRNTDQPLDFFPDRARVAGESLNGFDDSTLYVFYPKETPTYTDALRTSFVMMQGYQKSVISRARTVGAGFVADSIAAVVDAGITPSALIDAFARKHITTAELRQMVDAAIVTRREDHAALNAAVSRHRAEMEALATAGFDTDFVEAVPATPILEEDIDIEAELAAAEPAPEPTVQIIEELEAEIAAEERVPFPTRPAAPVVLPASPLPVPAPLAVPKTPVTRSISPPPTPVAPPTSPAPLAAPVVTSPLPQTVPTPPAAPTSPAAVVSPTPPASPLPVPAPLAVPKTPVTRPISPLPQTVPAPPTTPPASPSPPPSPVVTSPARPAAVVTLPAPPPQTVPAPPMTPPASPSPPPSPVVTPPTSPPPTLEEMYNPVLPSIAAAAHRASLLLLPRPVPVAAPPPVPRPGPPPSLEEMYNPVLPSIAAAAHRAAYALFRVR
jgi:hypothetical protein